jgi:Trypsin-like peptidase domain
MPDPVDPIAAADPWSRVVAYLSLSFNDEPIATGTGVVARHPSRGNFLITALHNLTGREPITKTIKSKTAALPNRVRVEAHFTDFDVNLYDGENDPNSNQPFYRTHRLGSRIDITVLPIADSIIVRSFMHQSFLTEQLNSQLRVHVAQECYIIGFPEGLVSRPQPSVIMPVWKTGHIATEPHVDFYEGIPVLLVDATTRRGMSGAPVIVRSENRTRLVGIYSGRFKQPLNDDSSPQEMDAQVTAELGWVFKSRLIDELIQQQ